MNSVSNVYFVSEDTTIADEGAILVHGVPVRPRRVSSAEELVEAGAKSSSGCAVVDVTAAVLGSDELERILASQSIELPVVAIIQRGDVETAVRVIKNVSSNCLLSSEAS